MAFQIIWSDSAIAFMKKLDKTIAKQIHTKVNQLETNPYRYVKKLAGSPFFRLRVGDYRIILEIKNEILQILIVKVGHRSTIYD